MSSALALANNNSALLSYLQGSAPETSPFTYGLTRNVGSYHRQKKVSVVKTGVAFSSEVRFELPRWGVMKNLTLRAAITMASGADTYYFGVLSGIIAKAEIKARDKVIATIYPETIVDWVKSQPDQAYKMWTDPDHMSLKSNYSAAEYLFDMPLPFSFTERINTAIMARFAEPLELVITTPTSTTGISAAPTNVDLTLKLVLVGIWSLDPPDSLFKPVANIEVDIEIVHQKFTHMNCALVVIATIFCTYPEPC